MDQRKFRHRRSSLRHHRFCQFSRANKKIFDGDKVIIAQNINAYLLDAPNVFIENRGKPPLGFPKMTKGNQPTDGGNLIISPNERDELIIKNPLAEKYIRQFIGAAEFIKGKLRYCLWLKDCPPNDLRKMPLVMKRLELVRDFRLKSPTVSIRRDADTPALFTQIRQPTTNFLVVPRVSGERRNYIPIDFLSPKVIVGDAVSIIPEANLYIFGVLTRSIHMAWVRIAAGRLKSDYRYTSAVYNNFAWCTPPPAQVATIEQSAQRILDVRKRYRNEELGTRSVVGNSKLVPSSQFLCSYADLYDPLTMPRDLRDAHRKNDRTVAAAYCLENILNDESKITAELLKLYAAYTK